MEAMVSALRCPKGLATLKWRYQQVVNERFMLAIG